MICINPTPALAARCSASATPPRPAGPGPRTARPARGALRPVGRILAAAALLLGAAASWAQDAPQPRLPTATLTVGMHRIVAELAVTPQQQQIGMMWRTEMGASEGMLFVNEDKGMRCFWMRNTLIPLTIAFLDDDGTIVNTADMQPRSDATHCSTRPVRFALEMPLGWFDRRGIKPGTRIRGGPLGP